MTEAEALSKVFPHGKLSKFAIEFEEQVNETRAAQTRVSRAIRVENSKVIDEGGTRSYATEICPISCVGTISLAISLVNQLLWPEYSSKFAQLLGLCWHGTL